MVHFVKLFCCLSLAVLLAACGASTTDDLVNARPTTVPAAVEATAALVAPTEASSVAPTVAPTEAPTATPEPALAAEVRQSGFSQDGQALGFGVVIANPNPAAALEEVRLQVIAYGADNVVLGTDDSTLPLLAPGVVTHFGGDMYLDVEQAVERIEAQITAGGDAQSATLEELPPFPVEATTFRETMFGQYVSGVVQNPFTAPLTDLYLGIVLFDEADQVIGGGFTFLPFLLPEGATAFDTSVKSNGVPARVEVSPLLSSLTLFTQRDAAELPELTLVEQGWGADDQVGYGIIVENPSPTLALEGSQYLAAAYAEDGSIIAVDSGYFGLILPGERTGLGGTIFFASDGVAPVRVEAQVFPGRTEEVADKQAFSFSNAAFLPGQFGAKVTAQITNPYGESVQNLAVNVVLRGPDGAIVGGGSGFSELIPASGTSAIEVSVVAAGEVATIELYGSESSITQFGE